MTTAVDRVFLDTNVLVYAHLPLSSFNPPAIAKIYAFAQLGADLWISRQILREFLATMTRPSTQGNAIPLNSLLSDVAKLETQFLIAEDGAGVTAQLLTLLQSVPCAGKQIHDANIAATMLAHGIPKLLTHNVADFKRFAGQITVLPLVP